MRNVKITPPRSVGYDTLIIAIGSVTNEFGTRGVAESSRLLTGVCDEILADGLHDLFPLHVWMTGSGTQFNVNVNEVIANRCCRLAGTALGGKARVHPHDHMSRSSNDSFLAAMQIARRASAIVSMTPKLLMRRATLIARHFEANDAFLSIVGYNRDDLDGGRLRWTDMMPAEQLDQHNRAVAEVETTGALQPSEREYVRKDGTRVPVLRGGATFEEGGNRGSVARSSRATGASYGQMRTCHAAPYFNLHWLAHLSRSRVNPDAPEARIAEGTFSVEAASVGIATGLALISMRKSALAPCFSSACQRGKWVS